MKRNHQNREKEEQQKQMEAGSKLLWEVEELAAVRASSLVGALVGSLPRAPRQNTRLSRPLLLREEELRLYEEEKEDKELQQKEELHLYREENKNNELKQREKSQKEDELLQREEPKVTSGSCSEEELTRSQEHQWEEFLGRSLEEQQQLCLTDRKLALTSSLSGRVSKAELESRLSSLEQSFTFPRSALAVQLSTCRNGLALQPIRREQLPSEPITGRPQSSDPMDVRFQVFKDLRRQGFYLTSGGKFGVDFLVYPGDPLRFHAHFMALCLPIEGTVPVADILSCIRLSSNVKKTLLLCSLSPAGGVIYSSMQWSHMS